MAKGQGRVFRRAGQLPLLAVLAAACCLPLGCSEPRVDTLSSSTTLHYLVGCAPESLEQLTVEVLGDFPTSGRTTLSFDASQGPGTLKDLAPDARAFRFSVTTSDYQGFALASAAQDESAQALVLPNGIACAVPLGALPALQGAAVTATARGEVLVAGGLADGTQSATRAATLLQIAQAHSRGVQDGLFVPRVGAAAVSVGAEVWVLGGAQGLQTGAPGLDSFERFDLAQARFTALGRLHTPRYGASALELPNGAVLLAGGAENVGGEPLASLERVQPDGASSELLSAELPWNSALTSMVLRDDGKVLLAGAAPDLALFDPETLGLDVLDPPDGTWDPGLIVPLPGARAALLETRAGQTTGVLWVLLPDGSYVRLSSWLSDFSGLTQARATALNDGRILLTGLRSGAPTARVIDPSSEDVRLRDLSRAPIRLVARADGSIVELAQQGAQVLRENARTPYDNPGGTLLADDTDVLALDVAAHWERTGLALSARAAMARFDVTLLQYERAQIEIRARGESELLLRRADGKERSIAVGGKRVGPSFCELDAKSGDSIQIERDGPSVTLRTPQGARSCALDGLTGPVALAVRALSAGVKIESLTVLRQ